MEYTAAQETKEYKEKRNEFIESEWISYNQRISSSIEEVLKAKDCQEICEIDLFPKNEQLTYLIKYEQLDKKYKKLIRVYEEFVNEFNEIVK